MVITCSAVNCYERFTKGGRVTFHRFPKDTDKQKLWQTNLRRENFVVTKYSYLCSNHFVPDCFETQKFGGTWLKEDAVPTIFDFSEPKQKLRKNSKKRSLDKVDYLLLAEVTTTKILSPPESGNLEKRKLDNSEQPQQVITDEISLSATEDRRVTIVKLESGRNQICDVDEPLEKNTSEQLRDTQKCFETSNNENEESLLDLPKSRRMSYLGDFTKDDMFSPTKAQKALEIAQKTATRNRQLFKLLRMQNARLLKKVANLSDILDLREKSLISDSAFDVLGETNDRMLDDSNDKDSNIENSACEPTAFLEIGFSDVNESSPQSQKRKDSIYSPEPPKKKICQPNQEVAIKSVKPFNECVSQRDEFSVYGEHIANKLRYSCRSRLEIAMAQRQIDDACYKLVVGEFSQFPQSTDQTSSDNQLTF